MAKAFDAAFVGISLDLNTKYVNYEEEQLYYSSPEEYFSFGKSLTPCVMLYLDYLPFDFTHFLYKGGTTRWG